MKIEIRQRISLSRAQVDDILSKQDVHHTDVESDDELEKVVCEYIQEHPADYLRPGKFKEIAVEVVG